MANIFTLKHGEGKPSNGVLQPYELGYAHDGFLYIGDAVKQTVGIKVDFATNAENATNAINANNLTSILTLEKGGTGASDAATARSNLGVNLTNLGLAASASELNILDGATITTAELNYVKGVTSPIQTQLNEKEPTISLTASRALVSNSSGKVAVSAVTSTELGYLDGVTSAIQTQLNGKEPTISLTASRALVSNSSGKVAVSAVTSKELGYLDGVTSAIQTQLNTKISNLTLLVSNFTLTSEATTKTIRDAGYKAFVVMGHMGSLTSTADDRGYVSLVIPSDMINVGESNALLFSLSGAGDAKYFIVYKSSTASNSTITFKNKGYYGAGVADNSMRIYGLK